MIARGDPFRRGFGGVRPVPPIQVLGVESADLSPAEAEIEEQAKDGAIANRLPVGAPGELLQELTKAVPPRPALAGQEG